jgi:putative sterol carrier protein
MAASAREFFEGLEGRIDAGRTGGVTASYRFDVDGAGSWHVAVADGHVKVAESGEAADCVIALREDTLLELLSGETKPTTAFMLGRIKVDGDMALALKLKELFF